MHEVASSSNINAIKIVKILLEHGANPNIPGGDHKSIPLHDAAGQWHTRLYFTQSTF